MVKGDKRLKEYMQGVKDAIQNDYGKIPLEWSAHLQQLEDFYCIYLTARDELFRTGEILSNVGNHDSKSPNIQIMENALNHMRKITDVFGLSPLSKSRLKEKPKAIDSPEEDYLSNL